MPAVSPTGGLSRRSQTGSLFFLGYPAQLPSEPQWRRATPHDAFGHDEPTTPLAPASACAFILFYMGAGAFTGFRESSRVAFRRTHGCSGTVIPMVKVRTLITRSWEKLKYLYRRTFSRRTILGISDRWTTEASYQGVLSLHILACTFCSTCFGRRSLV